MLFPTELPAWLASLHEEATKLGRRYRPVFEQLGRAVCFEPRAELGKTLKDRLAYIDDGRIDRAKDGRLLRFHSEGDILAGPDPRTSLRSEFLTRCLICSRQVWLNWLTEDPTRVEQWLHYQELQRQISEGLLAALVPENSDAEAVIQQYSAGEVIIEQGAPSSTVFVMLMGQAAVLRDGVAVGKVSAIEIFGEMGCFSGQPRNSTVQALADCTVQAVDVAEFDRLLKTRPTLVSELLRTLCQRIEQVNARVRLGSAGPARRLAA